MSVPPVNSISFKCVRKTSETISFTYLNASDNSPVDKTGKTLVAEFSSSIGGPVVFSITPTWDGGTGAIQLDFTPTNTDQLPGFYTCDLRVTTVSTNIVLVRIVMEVTASYP